VADVADRGLPRRSKDQKTLPPGAEVSTLVDPAKPTHLRGANNDDARYIRTVACVPGSVKFLVIASVSSLGVRLLGLLPCQGRTCPFAFSVISIRDSVRSRVPVLLTLIAQPDVYSKSATAKAGMRMVAYLDSFRRQVEGCF
jgi:hypothetical protein